jgi:hypothetical protein
VSAKDVVVVAAAVVVVVVVVVFLSGYKGTNNNPLPAGTRRKN